MTNAVFFRRVFCDRRLDTAVSSPVGMSADNCSQGKLGMCSAGLNFNLAAVLLIA